MRVIRAFVDRPLRTGERFALPEDAATHLVRVLRPLGDILYWMPPYCIDEAQLALLAQATRAAIVEATACA